ncbi:Translation initiation factor 2 subunit alpha [uncultured archaeon]|nr:Translation initiation factor 2 subunit alpha [uncultured archaeon]
MNQDYPKVGQLVIVNVRKIMQYGAFCSLEEYGNKDGLLHVSEVSPGWVKNIRDHVKEGQRLVLRVVNSDPLKQQIDLSLKRVSDTDKKRKLEENQMKLKGEKILERVKESLKLTAPAILQIKEEMLQEFGGVYDFFESIKQGKKPKSPLLLEKLEELLKIADKEIKDKEYSQRLYFDLYSVESAGLEKLKKALLDFQKLEKDGVGTIQYLGAPKYYIDLNGIDPKKLEKIKLKLSDFLLELEKKNFKVVIHNDIRT